MAINIKVAILQDIPSSHAGVAEANSNLRRLILASCPTAQISIFKPIDGEAFPNLSEGFNLVILTGGVFNLLAPEPKPLWVEETLAYIKEVSEQTIAGTKLLGICWGHQAIAYSLGGALDTLPSVRVGVETVALTQEGKDFFRKSEIIKRSTNIHKFHKRYVSKPANGFVALAADNEILISPSRRMLSFQGHPELTHEISRTLLAGDEDGYTSKSAEVATESHSLQGIDASHDGPELFSAIMSWALAREA